MQDVIELVKTQTGATVFRHAGRLLASAVDPRSEAREWLHRRLPLAPDIRSVLVLGAGCGYHIAELCAATSAQVVVLDESPEIVAQVREIHAFPPERVHFELVQNAKQLRKSEKIRQAITESFMVLCYSPSMQSHPEFYRDCRKQLLGRDWGSLNWQWKLKGYSCLDEQTKIGAEENLTIHDLENTELVQNLSEREAMLIKALRELVK